MKHQDKCHKVPCTDLLDQNTEKSLVDADSMREDSSISTAGIPEKRRRKGKAPPHAPPDPSQVPETASSGRGDCAGSSASSKGESSDDRSNAESQGEKNKRRRRKPPTENTDPPKVGFSSDYAFSLEDQYFLDELDVQELRRLYIPTLKRFRASS